ncbi:MAG: DUF3592 domain-containing protein [Bacteroidota bacterium]
MVKIIARLMWLLPVLLLVISASLVRAGLDQKETFEQGEAAVAEVVDFDITQRSEITYSYIDLRVEREGKATIEERLPLPISLSIPLEERETLAVRVNEGSNQQIMIEEIARAQWKMSLIHSGMSLFGAIMLIIGVGGWNRFLNRQGDPGAARVAETEEAAS